MKEKPIHHNRWTEKLEGLPLPDAGESWRDMEAILDKEMPVAKTSWRWMYWLLSMLLLIGVCTCPGPWTNTNAPLADKERQKEKQNRQSKDLANQSSSANSGLRDTKTVNKKAVTNQGLQPKPGEPVSDPGSDVLPEPDNNLKGKKEENRATVVGIKKRGGIPITGKHNKEIGNSKNEARRVDEISANLLRDPVESVSGEVNVNKPHTESKHLRPGDTLSSATNTPVMQLKDSTAATLPVDSIKQSSDSIGLNKRVQLRKADRGFAAAIGLNHFFPVGAQDRSTFNSSGESGTLADYLPVPQLRYHFNRHLYIMAEAQFNAPQYTKQVMLYQSKGDTNIFGQRLQHSVFVKKLFYFNLPVSVHVSPVKNVNIGAGIQYSRLKNAVGLFEEKQVMPNRPDSIKLSKIAPIVKSDSSYHSLKTSEWRFLVDANYTLKRFSFGLRYNKALSSFIQVPVSDVVLKQARNNSLQIYVRYTFWDQRNF